MPENFIFPTACTCSRCRGWSRCEYLSKDKDPSIMKSIYDKLHCYYVNPPSKINLDNISNSRTSETTLKIIIESRNDFTKSEKYEKEFC